MSIFAAGGSAGSPGPLLATPASSLGIGVTALFIRGRVIGLFLIATPSSPGRAEPRSIATGPDRWAPLWSGPGGDRQVVVFFGENTSSSCMVHHLAQ